MAQAPSQTRKEFEQTPAEQAKVPASGPTKEKLMNEESRSGPPSPKSPVESKEGKSKFSPGERGSNLKAEAFADAHTQRVEAEAKAYIDSETRKAEALLQKQNTLSEKVKMKEVAKATENFKKEEQRADGVVHNATLKADQIIAQAKEKAVMMKGNGQEVREKQIADANTAAEKEKAMNAEAKARKLAEVKDKAETLIASGELPEPEHKSVGQKLKQNLICSSS